MPTHEHRGRNPISRLQETSGEIVFDSNDERVWRPSSLFSFLLWCITYIPCIPLKFLSQNRDSLAAIAAFCKSVRGGIRRPVVSQWLIVGCLRTLLLVLSIRLCRLALALALRYA